MAEEHLVTNIVAKSDFSSLIGDLNKVSSRLVQLQEQLNSTNKTLAVQAANMQKAFSSTLRSTGQFSTHFVSLQSDVDKFGKSLDSGRMKLGQYYGAWQEHARTSGGLVRDLAKQQVMMQNAILQPLGKNAQGLMQFNVQVPRGLDLLKNKTAIARQEMMIMNKVIQDGANQVINWGKNTQWAGRQLTVGLTLPITMFGKAAADAFKQADEQLVRLTKVYGGVAATSAAELAKVRKDVSATARELSAAYGASYKDTIGLAADIAATGKQGAELIKSTQETTRLAVLGEVDRQEAMKATLAIQTAFSQNTEQLAESINFLNAVENQTSTSLADLVEAIPKAGPVIQAMGGSIKDLSLYMTAMREGGINASEGANALKSALASLINPTKVAKEMFMGFGIDLGGIVTKNAGNLTGTIMELQGALNKLNPLQKQQAIEQLFGKFQFARMNALFENLGKQGSQTLAVLDLMKASSSDLANIAGRELSQITESASGKYKRALETLKADMAGVGEQFLGVATKLINVVDSVLKFFDKLPDPIKNIIGFVGGLTALTGPVIMLTGLMANFFGYIAKGLFHLKALLKGGEGFKLLTPEILAAEKASSMMATSFYDDAKAAAVLKQAIGQLISELNVLESKANSARVALNPTVSTVAGAQIIEGSRRVADPSHPLIGAPYTRSFAHLNPVAGMTQAEREAQTIFGTIPNPGPLNQKIGKAPQAYMSTDLPIINGVTGAKGFSTGIVAAEAAKWHAMTGALSMQSQQELTALKAEVAATGTITTSLADSYKILLPRITEITALASDETALIVKQLQTGKLTVEQAQAKIISLNGVIETMIAETTTQVAAAQGRVANITTVPLTSQPVVDPTTGKSNMKELFHKGSTSKLVDQIARGLGVRTSGGGYSIATTRPIRLNDGGKVYNPSRDGNVVPGDPSINYDNTPALLQEGGFVLNQQASKNNPELVAFAQNQKAAGGKVVPALLTPRETYFSPETAAGMMPILERANSGEKISFRNLGGLLGGLVNPNRFNYGARKIGSGRSVVDTATIQSIWRAVFGKGTSAPKLEYEPKGGHGVFGGTVDHRRLGRITTAKINKDMEGDGVDPKVLLASIMAKQSPTRLSTDVLLKALRESGIISKSEERHLSRVLFTRYASAIKSMRKVNDTNNPVWSVSDAVLREQSLNLKNGREVIGFWEEYARQPGMFADVQRRSASNYLRELEYAGKRITIGKKLKGKNSSGGNQYVDALRGLSKDEMFFHSKEANDPFQARLQYLHDESQGLGANSPLGLNKLSFLTRNWPQKQNSHAVGYNYNLLNDDPHKGPLQIGNAASISQLPGMLKKVYYTDKFGHIGIRQDALPSGTPEEIAKAIAKSYMAGNKDLLARMRRETDDKLNAYNISIQQLLKPLDKKFSGTLYRGISGRALEDSLPVNIAAAVKLAKETGDISSLLGKEFIMRRSSFSESPHIASFFKGDNNGLLLQALVRNRNVTPLSELNPDAKFLAPYGQNWGGSGVGYRSEKESLMGGKFRVVDFKDGVLKIESVYGVEAREKGGNVNAGQPYLVGEKGPELFVPRNSGGIVPHYALGGVVRGGKYGYGASEAGGKYPVVESGYTSISQAERAIRNAGNPISRAAAQQALIRLRAAAAPAPIVRPAYKPGPLSVQAVPYTGNGGVAGRAFAPTGSYPYAPGLTFMNNSLNAPARLLSSAKLQLSMSMYALGTSIKADAIKAARTIKFSAQQVPIGLRLYAGSLQAAGTSFMSAMASAKNSLVAGSRNFMGGVRNIGNGFKSFLTMPNPGLAGGVGKNALYGQSLVFNPFGIGRQKSNPMYPGVFASAKDRMLSAGRPGMGTGMVSFMLGSAIGSAAGQKLGGATGAMIGGIALPLAIMGAGKAYSGISGKYQALKAATPEGMAAAKAATQAEEAAQRASLLRSEAQATKLKYLSGGPVAGKDVEAGFKAANMAEKEAAALAKVSAEASNVSKTAKVAFSSLRVFGAVARYGNIIGDLATIGQLLWVWKRHSEDVGKANRAVFGPTKASLKEVGIEYKSLTQRIKEATHAQDLQRKHLLSLVRDSKGTVVGGLTLTKKQLDAEVKKIKSSKSETVQDFNKTYGKEDVLRLAASLKQQYVSAGMSVTDATNKVYAFMKASNKGQYAFAAITSKTFKAIKDEGSAADYAIKTVVKNINSAKPQELAVGVQNVVNALDAYKQSLIGTKDTNGKIIDDMKAQQMALEKIIALKGSDKELSAETVAAISSQNYELGAVLSKAETLQGVYAKSALLQAGMGNVIDIGALTSEQSVTAARGMEFVQKVATGVIGKQADLAKTYSELHKSVELANKAQVDPKVQKALETRIKLSQKNIELIQKETQAKLKALEVQQKEVDFQTELNRLKLQYQQALAAGDMPTAARAQLDIQSLITNKQTEDAKQAIQDRGDAKAEAERKAAEAAQNKLDKANQKVAEAQIDAQKKATQESAIGNYISIVSNLLTGLTKESWAGKNAKERKDITDQVQGALADLKSAGGKAATKATQIQGLIDAKGGIDKWVTQNLADIQTALTKDPEYSKFKSSVDSFQEAVTLFAEANGIKASEINRGFKVKAETTGTGFNTRTTYTASGYDTAANKYRDKSGNIYIPDENGTWYKYVPPVGRYGTPTITPVPGNKKPTGLTKMAHGGAVPGYSGGGSDPRGSYAPGAGGYIRGNGTPTSDSILLQTGAGGFIRASDKEYMHPASAVAYYGTHFMDLVRAKSIPKKWVDRLIGKSREQGIESNYYSNRKFKGDLNSNTYIPGTSIIPGSRDFLQYRAAATGGIIPGYATAGQIVSETFDSVNRRILPKNIFRPQMDNGIDLNARSNWGPSYYNYRFIDKSRLRDKYPLVIREDQLDLYMDTAGPSKGSRWRPENDRMGIPYVLRDPSEIKNKKFATGGAVANDGWLQKWAKNISGQPAAEMFGTAQLLRLIAGIGKKGDNLGAAMVPLSFLGTGIGPKIANMGFGKLAYALPNKLYQLRNQAKVNSMIKSGMWHGSQPQGYRGEEFLQGTNVLEGAETYDPYYGMGFFSTTSKTEADSYAAGHNSLSNWGESYGSMNKVIGSPRGKYIDFRKGTNSLKWQDYSLAKALGVKRNGYLGNFMPENLGDIMNAEGITGAMMKRISAGRTVKSIQDAEWLAWARPAGVITTENYATGGAIPGYAWGGITGIGKKIKSFWKKYQDTSSKTAFGSIGVDVLKHLGTIGQMGISKILPNVVPAASKKQTKDLAEFSQIPAIYRAFTGKTSEGPMAQEYNPSVGKLSDWASVFSFLTPGRSAAKAADVAAKAEAERLAIAAAQPSAIAARIKSELAQSLLLEGKRIELNGKVVSPYKGEQYPGLGIEKTLAALRSKDVAKKIEENNINVHLNELLKKPRFQLTQSELSELIRGRKIDPYFHRTGSPRDPAIESLRQRILSEQGLDPREFAGFDTSSTLYKSTRSLEDLLGSELYHGGAFPEIDGSIALSKTRTNPSNWFGAPLFVTEGKNQALSYLIKNSSESPSLYKIQSNLKPHEVLDLRHGAPSLAEQHPFVWSRMLRDLSQHELNVKKGENAFSRDEVYRLLLAQEGGADFANVVIPGRDRLFPFHQISGLSPWLNYVGIKGIVHRGGTVLQTPDIFGKDIAAFKGTTGVNLLKASSKVKDTSAPGHDVLAYTRIEDSIASIKKSAITRESLGRMLTTMDSRGLGGTEMERIIEQLLLKSKGKGFKVGYANGGMIPRFDSGINMVPADMLAMIHKNEAVVPANMNPFNPNANMNAIGSNISYTIAPVINPTAEMDTSELVRLTTREVVSAIKSIDSMNNATMGRPGMRVIR